MEKTLGNLSRSCDNTILTNDFNVKPDKGRLKNLPKVHKLKDLIKEKVHLAKKFNFSLAICLSISAIYPKV